MRFYVNSKSKLIYAPDYHDRIGDYTADSIQIYTSKFTEILEDEIILAISEVLKRYEYAIPKKLVDELIEEKKRQNRFFSDTSSMLTEVINDENNEGN
jgi:hypothetical protein